MTLLLPLCMKRAEALEGQATRSPSVARNSRARNEAARDLGRYNLPVDAGKHLARSSLRFAETNSARRRRGGKTGGRLRPVFPPPAPVTGVNDEFGAAPIARCETAGDRRRGYG